MHFWVIKEDKGARGKHRKRHRQATHPLWLRRSRRELSIAVHMYVRFVLSLAKNWLWNVLGSHKSSFDHAAWETVVATPTDPSRLRDCTTSPPLFSSSLLTVAREVSLADVGTDGRRGLAQKNRLAVAADRCRGCVQNAEYISARQLGRPDARCRRRIYD